MYDILKTINSPADVKKVKNYGLKREFYDRYNPQELLFELGMTSEQIVADVKKLI